jgi:alpha-beta hydrolase superfamily lysophospholipase
MKRTGAKDAYVNWRKDMPVLLISGQDDPVGDSGKGVPRVETAMRKAGMKNVQMKLFPGARHDLLHEEVSGNAEEARKIIALWLSSAV